jgi:L-2-hydroxyglutarate oxidase LhgO
MPNEYKLLKKPCLVIIGGGIIGVTIAREAAISKIFGKIIIIEKENKIGFHSSSRNSGVIHAGFYYSPETKKAEFCSEGNRLMREYILKNSLSYNPCGKVVISKNDKEDQLINTLGERGKQNNCEVEVFDAAKLEKFEPAAKTNNLFLWSPNTWSASPKEILSCILKEIKEHGVEIYLGKRVIQADDKCIFFEDGQKLNYDFVINAAGGYALKIANLFGVRTKYKILPFKGLYLKSTEREKSFKTHIYPVPDIEQPFLGIHTTITSDGFLKLGPTAIPAFSPENYRIFERLDNKLTPEIIALQCSLFINNTFKFRELAIRESRYIFKSNIIDAAQKLTSIKLNEIQYNWYSPGIRAQLYNTESLHLENDIVIENNDKSFHLLNSISPAWTCAFKTSTYVLNKIKSYLV